jgi:hypothetical protein
VARLEPPAAAEPANAEPSAGSTTTFVSLSSLKRST